MIPSSKSFTSKLRSSELRKVVKWLHWMIQRPLKPGAASMCCAYTLQFGAEVSSRSSQNGATVAVGVLVDGLVLLLKLEPLVVPNDIQPLDETSALLVAVLK